MGDAAQVLEHLLEVELLRPPPASARALADAILERFGDATVAIVFYGSCLRRGSDEGVLDFYVLVDDYRRAYGSRVLAWLNAALPPNVFYFERPEEPILRMKYAVLSARDFQRGAAGHSLRPTLWARFCQPLLAVHLRDDAARDLLVRGAARSVLTALEKLVPLLPASGGERRFSARAFWEHAFHQTYGYEMRPEPPGASAALYAAAPERFDRAAALGLQALSESAGWRVCAQGDPLRVALPGDGGARGARAWRRRRPAAKLIYLLGLAKTTLTFGDWLPYALWKLERHSGERLVPSERQLRHPWIFGWPLLFRALWRRALR
jgi:hypothetical protein